jgi:hypothetical protein
MPSLVLASAIITVEMASNVIADLASSFGGPALEVLVLVTCAAATLFAFSRWEKELSTPGIGIRGGAKLAKRRGVILLMGLDSASEQSGVTRMLSDADSLEFIALIGTPQTSEKGVVNTIRQRFMPSLGHDLSGDKVLVLEGNNAEWIDDNERSVAAAIDWMRDRGLSPSEIVVDVTRGRRPMHFGALLAAEEAKVEVQYLTQAWSTSDNKPQGDWEFKLIRELYPE